MKKEIKTNHALSIIFAWFFLTIALIVIILGPLNLTGHAIYENQPDSSTSQDTYIRENSNTNYATSNTMKIGKTAAGAEFKGLIRLNVSSIPQADTIISAKLQLYFSATSNTNNVTLKLYRITSNWNAAETGWNNATSSQLWTLPGGDYIQEIDSAIFNNTLGYHNFTITNAARNWVNQTHANYGLMIVSTDASNGDTKEFSSSDDSTPSQRPKIIIEHTPNAAPTIENLSADSNSSSPKQIGEQITFDLEWSDLENNDAQMFICNSSDITISGCADKTFCSTSLNSNNQIQCSYTTTSLENQTTSFWAAICDETNCSSTSQSQFYANHKPIISLTQPNGGETVNQSVGNYSILFDTSDPDSNSLTASIYYGTTQNSTTFPIATNLNLSEYCTDLDSNTATTNPCNYSWYSAGIYGTFFLTIILNDSYSLENSSSANSFDVRSLIDILNPQITSQWTDSTIHSGEQIYFHADIIELNINTVWVSINTTPQTNLTMTSTTSPEFNISWIAPEIGSYSFKTWANDTVGNTNDTMPWTTFNISKPIAITSNELSPSVALPFHTIKITGDINTTDSISGTSAYLNTPEGFAFLINYPQNLQLGDISTNQTKTAEWFISCPITESTYTLNITYSDQYSNTWQSANFQTQITSAISGGYEISATGYPEVEATGTYYAESTFKQNGQPISADSITITLYDPAKNLILTNPMSTKSTGIYNYSYSVGAAPMGGQWETRINATKDATSYYTNEFWKVVGALFDVRNITIINSSNTNLDISVILENIGNNPTDLFLQWNLTRTDTGETLDSGFDTIGVGITPITHRISPTTSYVGQTKITFMGTYLDTEKAAAYKIFSTTKGGDTPTAPGTGGGSGGGSGGGDSGGASGGGGGSGGGSGESTSEVTTSETKQEGLKDHFQKELERLKEKSSDLNKTLLQKRLSDLLNDLEKCQTPLNKLKQEIEKEEFINADITIEEAEECINEIETKSIPTKSSSEEKDMENYWIWIITWLLILVLIIIIISAIYVFYRKLSIINLIKQTPVDRSIQPKSNTVINEKLKRIRENLNRAQPSKLNIKSDSKI